MAQEPDQQPPGRDKSAKRIVILIPVFDDWQAARLLIESLDATFAGTPHEISVTMIDDGSTRDPGVLSGSPPPRHIRQVEVVRLSSNLGHQRAISVGLVYVHEHRQCDLVITMDCDGEDRPQDLPRLIETTLDEPTKLVFARRVQRREGWLFRLAYRFYKQLFSLLTGKSISFGNFCAIPGPLLERVVHVPDIWNHFAAGIIKSRIPYILLPTDRGVRLSGRSRMNFQALVVHGMSAISVFVESVSVRLIALSIALIVASACGIAVVLVIRLFTDYGIPGWATNATLGLVIVSMQAMLLSTLLTFVVLSHRSQRNFIPVFDCTKYVLRVETLHDGK